MTHRVGAWAALAASAVVLAVTPCAGAWEYHYENAHTGEEEPTSTGTGVLPGAIQPAPVDQKAEEEFWMRVHEWEGRGATSRPEQQPWSIRLTPGLEGGWAGWCMTVRVGTEQNTHCGVAPQAANEIYYERWEASGSTTRGIALTEGSLSGVAVDYSKSAVAVAPVAGPEGVDGAIAEVAAAFPAPSGWFDEFEPVSHGIRSSGERGWLAPQRAYTAGLPAIAWAAPQPPPAGVCGLSVRRLRGLRERSGHVATALTPNAGIAGGGYASCADTELSYAGSSYDAGVLVDAARPGVSIPVQIPGASAVRGHRGLYAATGWNGPLLGRRVGSAWLVVEGGGSLRRRMQVLAHLQAHVV